MHFAFKRLLIKTLKFNLNCEIMRRLFTALVLSAFVISAHAQRSIDRLFDKYSGSDGFVTLTFNGNILKLLNSFEDEKDKDSWSDRVTEIRILAQDDDKKFTENFYDMVIKAIDRGQYEEFMRVKESDQDLILLVRTEGNRIKEFLMVGGGEDNLIIQIKGNLTRQDAKELSSDIKKDHNLNLISEHK